MPDAVGRGFPISVHAQGVDLDDGLRTEIGVRVAADLRAYASRIAVTHVRLWVSLEGQGPAMCQVRVELKPSGGLAVGETGSDLGAAIAHASERMAASLDARFALPDPLGVDGWFRA